MIDRREEILNSQHQVYVKELGLTAINPKDFPLAYKQAAIYAMDEYFKERALELLQFMGENEVEASCTCEAAKITGEQLFYYKGEWITKEQLFENFL